MPPARMRGDGRKAKNPKKTIARLLSYLNQYRLTLIVVVVCILITSISNAASSASLGTLVDDYVTPMLRGEDPNLLGFLLMMAGIYLVGIISSFLHNFLMVRVAQGTQKTIRDKMFTHMQRLPIRYFDTHSVGDLMSRYTSDIDTLRQMVSQSIPQCISSAATLLVVFIFMIKTSWILTLVLLVTVSSIVFVTKTVVGRSAKFFIGQQRTLGALNGYVEEMIHGQRVIKVFNREEISKEEFDQRNEALRSNAFQAGAWTNLMGPVNNNLGYIQYAILAIVGGLIAVSTDGSLLTLGDLISFLVLSRTFNQPISHISSQINAIVMALAGAERIFELMDEEVEADEGYVTLVNAKEDENGNLTECPERTGRWAWRHPHQADGSVTYTELKGDITMYNVDFGYVPEKQVLYDVTLYAHPGQKIAFVGATGAVETANTSLINRR